MTGSNKETLHEEKLLKWCEKNHTSILHFNQFPPLLQKIPNPPRFLFFRGNPEVLKKSMVAIVGAREASSYGLACAFRFARELTGAGFVLVSGLAKGIDGASHWGAVNRAGETLAVMGAGFETLYPRENRRLAYQILEKGGAWLSEYLPWTPPLPAHFPQRNRIISGLSSGVVVIEARKKSGSLITALSGLEQGREVFVVPGPIDKPDYQGSHHLIQQGAKLVTSIKDILEDLPLTYSFCLEKADSTESSIPFGKTFTLSDWMGEQKGGERSLFEAIFKGDVFELAPQRYLSTLPNHDFFRTIKIDS